MARKKSRIGRAHKTGTGNNKHKVRRSHIGRKQPSISEATIAIQRQHANEAVIATHENNNVTSTIDVGHDMNDVIDNSITTDNNSP